MPGRLCDMRTERWAWIIVIAVMIIVIVVIARGIYVFDRDMSGFD
jgi:hypothetical protein